MGRTRLLLLGWACLLINGYEAASALVTGRMSGLASFSNPDNPPSLADRPGTFLFFLAFYLGLCGLGIYLLLKARNMPRDG